MTARTFTFSVTSSATPAWYSAMTSGAWNSFQTVGESRLENMGSTILGTDGPYNGNINRYSSGVLKTGTFYDVNGAAQSGTHLIIWGGGHGDYGGNQFYAFGPLDSGTPTWRRLTNRSSQAVALGNSSYLAWYSDGLPAVPHTYDGIAVDPTRNKFYSLNCKSPYPDGTSGTARADIAAFDFAVSTAWQDPLDGWTAEDELPDGPSAFQTVGTDYDSTRDCIWWTNAVEGSGTRTLTRFDLSTQTWATSRSLTGVVGGVGAVFRLNKTTAGGLAANSFGVVAADNGLWRLDVSDYLNATPVAMTYTNSGPASFSECYALDWDETQNCYVWGNRGLSQLWRLSPPVSNPMSSAWTWQQIYSGAGVEAGDNLGGGPFGRFRRVNVNGVKGFVCQHHTSYPVYFWKD